MNTQPVTRTLKLVSNFYIDRNGTPWWGNTSDQTTLQIELEQRYADRLFEEVSLLINDVRNAVLDMAWYIDIEGELIPKFELVK